VPGDQKLQAESFQVPVFKVPEAIEQKKNYAGFRIRITEAVAASNRLYVPLAGDQKLE
jgi:hypothetical protein